MGYPTYGRKHDAQALFTPDDFAAQKREEGRYPDVEPPRSAIFCYQPEFFGHVVDAYETTEITGLFPKAKFYLLDETDGDVAVLGNIGVGAPATIAIMEGLIEFGVENFVMLEHSGCLQETVDLSDVIICDRAIRDEGTSYHYAEDAKYADASEELVETLESGVEDHDITYHVGTSWTTDAFYRETIPEVEQYQKEGVLTVDMEASAMFTVANYRDRHAASVFVAFDYLNPSEWQPKVEIETEYLDRVLRSIVDSLASEP